MRRFISANAAGSPLGVPCDSITSTRPVLPAASAQRRKIAVAAASSQSWMTRRRSCEAGRRP
jgi:hypothetical protein